MATTDLPYANRPEEDMPGHWLLAKLGKRVLRPGGRELTEQLLTDADLTGADVLEIAPGLGRTAVEILALDPRSYRGVESDEAAATMAEGVVGDRGTITVGQAQDTGLAADNLPPKWFTKNPETLFEVDLAEMIADRSAVAWKVAIIRANRTTTSCSDRPSSIRVVGA